MTREEAIILLGIDEESENDEIIQKFQSLYSDYRIRLTNAPTPNLRKLYQKNLHELEDAKNVLLEEGLISSSDLPISQPIFEASKRRPNSSQERPDIVKPSKKKSTAPFQPKKMKLEWPILVAIGSVSLTVLFAILWGQSSSKVTDRDDKIEGLNSQIAGMSYLMDIETSVSNQKMKIQNTGNASLMITAINSNFRRGNDFRKFEYYSGKTIRSGGTLSLEKVSGDDVVWNGDVVFYSFDCKYKGEYYHVAGHWRTDAPEGVLKLNLD